MTAKKSSAKQAGQGKAERYMKPSLLLALQEGQARYGYDLLTAIQDYGFVQGKPPPGMVYRHLRQLEEEGFVSSAWDTEESGPARRMYELTPEGREALAGWVDFMEQQAGHLQRFVARYRKLSKDSQA